MLTYVHLLIISTHTLLFFSHIRASYIKYMRHICNRCPFRITVSSMAFLRIHQHWKSIYHYSKKNTEQSRSSFSLQKKQTARGFSTHWWVNWKYLFKPKLTDRSIKRQAKPGTQPADHNEHCFYQQLMIDWFSINNWHNKKKDM